MHGCHVMLEWPCVSLQNGGFSFAPRVSLIGGWVEAYQADQNDLVGRHTP